MCDIDLRYIRPLHFESCRFGRLTRNFPAHFHSWHMFGCLTRGERRLLVNGKVIYLRPMELVSINPGVIHTCVEEGKKCADWVCVHISSQTMAAISRSHGINLPNFNIFKIRALAQNLLELREDALNGYELAISNSLRQLVCSVSAASPDKDKKAYLQEHGDQDVFRQICQDLAAAPELPASLERMANMAGMNRYGFLRKFSAFMGLTPWRYLEMLRLEKARKLLARGVPINECALDAGFHDQSHMHKQFTAILGFTPGIYRKAYQTGE